MKEARTVGPYTLGDRVEGHDGDLYEGERDGRSYLLAFFDLRRDDADELDAEIERTRALAHPAIVPAVDQVDHETSKVLVFRLDDGITLQELITECQGLPAEDEAAYHIGENLFSALAAAHGAHDADGKIESLVHGRLGPQQLFVSWEGEVKLLGFGMSVLYRLSNARAAAAAADDPYAAPEIRAGGAYTVRANVYSAALMMWSLLTGQQPPADGAVTPLKQARPDLPPAVVTALDQALCPALLDRRITAEKLARVFEEAAGDDGLERLVWFMEPLRAIVTFDEALVLRNSLPPVSKLSDAPAISSLPAMITLPPDSHDFDKMVPIPPLPAPPDDDYDDTAVTIPAPPRRGPR